MDNQVLQQKSHYYVLRLDHRTTRDKRLTTHIGLIARAFEAKGFFYSGEEDLKMEESLRNVNDSWSEDDSFIIEYWDDWLKNLKLLLSQNSVLVHLTMYGVSIKEVQDSIFNCFVNEHKNIIFIVGGSKVPDVVYTLSRFNVSVTNQPHSEAGALAVVLDRIFPNIVNKKEK